MVFRSDVSLAFLAAWVFLKTGRVLYLGQTPMALLHQLQSGNLIVFAFFMISDPKTTPDHHGGRILFACLVAGAAFVMQHRFWIQNPLLWSLALLSPLVPLIDSYFKAGRFQWTPQPRSLPCPPFVSPLRSPSH